jgi:hypothetical protein
MMRRGEPGLPQGAGMSLERHRLRRLVRHLLDREDAPVGGA